MVGVIEEINESTGELKKYELDAAAENQKKGFKGNGGG